MHHGHHREATQPTDAPAVLLLDGGTDASATATLMRELAVRGRSVEIARDEVAVMRHLIRRPFDLLILVMPTSTTAQHQLLTAIDHLDTPPAIVGWDPVHSRLHDIDNGRTTHATTHLTGPDPIPRHGGSTSSNVSPVSPDGPDADPWLSGDPDPWPQDEWAAETLTAAELDALLGEMEPSGS